MHDVGYDGKALQSFKQEKKSVATRSYTTAASTSPYFTWFGKCTTIKG
jgi:hypothetical protein